MEPEDLFSYSQDTRYLSFFEIRRVSDLKDVISNTRFNLS
jgi:hypothetical protein